MDPDFADTRHSVDWAIAWAMIGEWTNHQLFPPPKSGEWRRFAHVNGLEEGFRHRQPSLVTWARACFEQGALPSLSVLPGAVEVRSLVGDFRRFRYGRHVPRKIATHTSVSVHVPRHRRVLVSSTLTSLPSPVKPTRHLGEALTD